MNAPPDGYTELHRHVLGEALPPLLARHADVMRSTEVIADVGCGDGTVVFALTQMGHAGVIYAIDRSPGRVQRAAAIASNVEGIVGDATAIPLADGVAAGVVCSQVIEHVPDQDAVAAELHRVLRPGGWFYLGSVARRRLAWWVYRREGRWWLDPTHVREYANVDELVQVAERAGLQVDAVETTPVRFAVADLFLRLLVVARIVSPALIARSDRAARLRRVRVPIPGYSAIEVWGTKPEGPAA